MYCLKPRPHYAEYYIIAYTTYIVFFSSINRYQLEIWTNTFWKFFVNVHIEEEIRYRWNFVAVKLDLSRLRLGRFKDSLDYE